MSFQTLSRRNLIRVASFLLTAFLVLGGLAIQGRVEAAAARRSLANGYRHAFAELAVNLDGLAVDLQKGLYATTPPMLGALCTQIYGKAIAAQIALGELPYANVELEQTAAFLAKTGDYAAALSRAAAESGGWDAGQREALRGLAVGASALSSKVAGIQSDLLTGAVSPEDVRQAEARLSAAEGGGRSTSSFQTIERDFPELPSLIYDGPFSAHIAGRNAKCLEKLPAVTADEARTAAAQFLGFKPEIFALVSSSGGELPVYGFTATVDGGEVYVEVTHAGGRVMELFSSRAVGEAAFTEAEGIQAAADFLNSHGYPHMTVSYFVNQGNVLTVNFAAQAGEVLCYPDLIKLSLALDSGQVVGFEAKGYLMNHCPRSLPAPSVSAEQAEAAVSQELRILSRQLTLIPTGGQYEVLTWEFKCQAPDGRHVLVYLNAQTGQEEKILLLLEDESGTLVI